MESREQIMPVLLKIVESQGGNKQALDSVDSKLNNLMERMARLEDRTTVTESEVRWLNEKERARQLREEKEAADLEEWKTKIHKDMTELYEYRSNAITIAKAIGVAGPSFVAIVWVLFQIRWETIIDWFIQRRITTP